MSLVHCYKRKRIISLSFFLMLTFIAKFALTQSANRSFKNPSDIDSVLPLYRLGIQIQASILPKGNIITTGGNYSLQSRLQSSYGLGINYQANVDNAWSMIYGLQINLTQSNYFLHIPDSDLSGFLSTAGAPQIEDKQVYFRIGIPIQLSYGFAYNKTGFYNFKGGLKLNYSGFSNDERITVRLADSNFQLSTIFKGILRAITNKSHG